jgi:hypothetical protein
MQVQIVNSWHGARMHDGLDEHQLLLATGAGHADPVGRVHGGGGDDRWRLHSGTPRASCAIDSCYAVQGSQVVAGLIWKTSTDTLLWVFSLPTVS